MLRRIMLTGILTGAVLTVGFWTPGRGFVVAQDARPSRPKRQNQTPPSTIQTDNPKPTGAQRVAQNPSTAAVQSYRTAERPEKSGDPIVIPGGRLRLFDLEDVPSQRDGVLMFLGTEVKEGQNVPPFDAIPVQIGKETKQFRRLREGDVVQSDQLLAQVDDTLARADVGIKTAKLESARAEAVAADKTRDEAMARYDTAKKLYGATGGRGGGQPAISLEDLRGALLTYNRYVEEAVSKKAAIEVAKEELKQSEKTVSMYEIRPKVSGIVKSINKHPGEAVKSLEPVMQIQNYDRLRVDALLQEQYANRLDKGMEVYVEPTFRESPRQTFVGHRGLITGVAVSKDPRKPLIVSCSDDRTVRIWELSSSGGRAREHVLKNAEPAAPFQAVACTPRDAAANLCLAGDAQGNGFLWDLNDLQGEPRKLNGHHLKAITCVAFSPDGKSCATGSQDQQIKVWDTATGTLRCTISGHRNVITALYFASPERLISISRDPSVRIWEITGDRYKEAKNGVIPRREDYVDNLGVSPDGQHMMDENFGEMRVVSVPNADNSVPKTEAILRPTTLGKKFVNFAIFAPNGQMALTTPETGGVLHLWRINYNQGRSFELRQFVPAVRGAARSAAFAPDGSFVVAGVSDRIYLWPMPGKEDVDPIPARITNIDKPIEAVDNQVKVTAELENPGQRLRPGDVVTIVAYPQK
ncbi:MAG TPA: HlyD family efflux transporter periplasmic adaptor subunit [Gemmataceae bacterium]|nr:HlyD family efflux transporter periplasmic adaptor subunit [Gemmataceae bacterium]